MSCHALEVAMSTRNTTRWQNSEKHEMSLSRSRYTHFFVRGGIQINLGPPIFSYTGTSSRVLSYVQFTDQAYAHKLGFEEETKGRESPQLTAGAAGRTSENLPIDRPFSCDLVIMSTRVWNLAGST